MKKNLLLLILMLVAGNAFAQCTPVYYFNGIDSGVMRRFALAGYAGASINDTLPVSSLASGYANRSSSVATLNLQQGRAYSASVSYDVPLSFTGNQVWIDLNNDGVFADSEAVSTIYPATAAFAVTTGSVAMVINIPVNAPAGTHRLRIRNVAYTVSYTPGYSASNLDPCAHADAINRYYTGVTADYNVNIVALTLCSGTPVAGVITGPASVCSSAAFSLSVTGDTVAGGLTYQWYSAATGSSTLATISGATAKILRSAGQSAATDYYLVATCSVSGMRDTTAVQSISMNPFYDCYCNNALGGNSYDATIDSVSIPGSALSVSIVHNTSTYTSYADSGIGAPTLLLGDSYAIVVKSGGTRRFSASMWIDFNHNGSFDSSEYIRIDSSAMAGGTTYGTFTVPLISDTGVTGMRIRTVMDSIRMRPSASCAFETSGETEDFILRLAPNAHCGGVPSAGTAYASVDSVCAGVPFFISSSHYSTAFDLNYQWYTRAAGSSAPFTPIGAATSSVFTVNSQTAASEYKLVVTCPTGGFSDTSAAVTVGENPYYLCYCSPLTNITLNDFATAAPIDSVAIAGTTLDNFTGTGVYASYYPFTAVTTATMLQGTHYALTINSNGTSNYNAGVWIDYNHNGSFESMEYMPVVTNQSAGTPSTIVFTIPATSDTGWTGMRVRTIPNSSVMTAFDACAEEYAGATADYVINILPGTPCSGGPAAGVAAASVASVCAGQSFLLTNTSAANTLGISYQWVSKATGSGTYSAISGATSISYTIPTQSVSTDYSLLVSCSFSGITDTATVATVAENPFFLCYCSPLLGTVLNDSAYAAPIDSFSVATIGLNNRTPGSTAIYSRFYPTSIGTTGTLKQGSTYLAAIKSVGTSNYKAGVWIDYDHSGTFDNSEFVGITTHSVAGAPAYSSFTIPEGADTGRTGMRVRTLADGSSFTSGDGCSDYFYGSTQDYVVTIVPAAPCSGTPAAGVAVTYVSAVCQNEPFVLNATGITNTDGTTFQWIKAATGSGTYTNISGATTPVFTVSTQATASDYRLVTTCTYSGGKDTTSVVTMAMKPFYLCYCAPVNGTTLNTSATAAPVDSVSVATTTLNNYMPGNTTVYQQFYPLTATTTDSMRQGFTYTFALNSNGSDNYNAGVWIDFDRNGTFDAAEYFPAATNIASGTRSTASIYVPVTADTGYTGLRVRTTQYSYALNSTDACTSEYLGATQDYIVRIAPGIPCSGAPTTGRASASASAICAGTAFTLTDTGASVAVAISYQWYSRPAGTGALVAISGATNATYVVSSQSVSTDYVYMVTCGASSTSRYSDTVTVAETPYYSCYCGSPLGATGASTEIDNIAIPGSALHIASPSSVPYRVFGRVGDSTGVIQRSLPYNINLHVTGGSNFNAGMWIDYNHDGTFEASEYIRIDTNTASGTATSTSFTIPGSADTGITGVRIRATQAAYPLSSTDACTDIGNSQTFDLKMTIDTLVLCSGTPNAGVVVSSTPFACPSMSFTLTNDSFSVASGVTYQWIKRNTGSGSFSSISGATAHSYAVTGQTLSTDYALVARCAASGLTDTTNIKTITENPFDSCYCSPPTGVSLMSTGGDTDIVITSIVGTTMYIPVQHPDSNGYVAVPPTPSYNTASMQKGSSYATTVYVNYTVHTIAAAAIWIDYNHNSVFDSAEYTPLTESSDHSSWSASLNIPYSSSLGLTGMRVMTAESGSTLSATSACGSITSGEVQDEIVTITMPPCYSISSASVINVTDTNATGIWGRLSGALGYEYVIDLSSSAPTGSGTPTTDTFVHSGCLTSGTNYYLHVRDSCGAGYFSSWITEAFTTLPCRSESGLTATAITDRSATIHWDTVTGSSVYEYVVDTSSTAPSGSGTSLADTTVNLTGLVQGTLYYAHVRSQCPCGNRSAWVTIPFTTICDTISHLSDFALTDTSVSIKWDSIRGYSNYAYIIDTSAGAPSSGWATTVDSSAYVHGLTPGTVYYAHVSHECSGAYSTWTTISFTTPYCDTVAGLTATPNDTGVVVSWTPVSGSLGYYYVVNTVAAAPSGTGSFTTSTTIGVSGLVSSTLYYAHVRTGCTGGYSRWTTVPFTTLPCDTVRGLTVTSICDTTASVLWTAGGGYGYLYIVNTLSVPTGASSFTSFAGAGITTLSPGTTYYAHVRHMCSIIDTSAWETVRFNTLPCDTVSGLGVTGITSTGATINWTASTCSGGYQYAVNTSASAPSSGTFTGLNTLTETGLTSGTTYYAHIRVYCGAGVYSGWTTIPFTTVVCDTAGPVVVTGIVDNGASISWSAVSGALGYYYSVDNSPSCPAAGSGTFTASTSATLTGLSPHTLYYAHVSTECATGVYATCVSIPFTTTNLGVAVVGSSVFDIQTYPNPVTGILTVKVAGGGSNRTVVISDLTGKAINKTQMQGDKVEIDVSAFASGIYFIRYADDSHIQTMKLNKE